MPRQCLLQPIHRSPTCRRDHLLITVKQAHYDMTTTLAFWVIMLIWLIFGFWSVRTPAPNPPGGIRTFGGTLLLFVLFALLGWKVFGPALHN